jgi:hypothetical protein
VRVVGFRDPSELQWQVLRIHTLPHDKKPRELATCHPSCDSILSSHRDHSTLTLNVDMRNIQGVEMLHYS